MAVSDTYEVSLFSLVDEVQAYFDAAGLAAKVSYGDSAITQQENTAEDGRVVFALSGGTYAGPMKSGSKSPDKAMRNAYVLLAEVEVHIWAWDRTALEDQRAQEAMWWRLHEYTLCAIRRSMQARFEPSRLVPVRVPVEERFGVARTVILDRLHVPVHCSPEDVEKIAVTAQVTFNQTHPQGKTAEGESIPPVVNPVATVDIP